MYSLIERRELKTNKGITLISLVVTIIILLILAGISIGMLSGDNGLLNKAGQARNDTIVGGEKEQVELAYISAAVKNLGGNVTGQNLQDELDTSVGENKTTVTGTSTLKVKFKDTQNEYKVSQDGKVEKKNSNPNALEISELNENASTYFGWDVINYAETLPSNLQDTKWQLFYAGALNDETEERIYLISKEYVKNTQLPAKNGTTPVAGNNNYKASFEKDYNGNITNVGIIPQYTNGSDLITDIKLKKLNNKYFSWLKENNTNSTNKNMSAVAYMMDTNAWSPFATSLQGYAEYAIGGPTVELLFTAYNKYKELTGNSAYTTQVIDKKGYQISKDGGTNYVNDLNSLIEHDVTTGDNKKDSPYSVLSLSSQAEAYWVASPSMRGSDGSTIYYVGSSGGLYTNPPSYTICAFRPLVLLDSNYTLEKIKDKDGNDAFKIVEQ